MPEEATVTSILPPIDQVGYAVKDVDEAVRRYEPLVGKFEVSQYELEGVDYRGRSVDCTLKIAIGHSGPLEIEFIEVVTGETLYDEFFERGVEGPHHIRFTIDDLDATTEKLKKLGLQPVWGKRFGPGLAFAYLEDPSGRLVELFECK